MANTKKIVIRILIGLAITTVSIVCLLIAAGVFVSSKQNQPFPPTQLKIADGALLYRQDWNGKLVMNPPTGYRIRVTNKASVGVKEVKFRLDFFSASNSPIDGREITFYDEVPPRSTRTIDATFFPRLKELPGGWKYSAQFVEAKKASFFDNF